MPLHPDVAAGLARQKEQGWVPRRTLAPQEAREMARRLKGPPPDEPVYSLEHTCIPGPECSLTLRIYRPRAGVLPALLFFHGGGWLLGDLDTSDTTCRRWAKRADCLVVSVEYRLAPEHPYPAALDDCYAATCWLAAHGAELDADTQRIAVAGVSSGGNLAAAVTLLARDRGEPSLAGQVLVCPVLDCDFETQSYLDNAEGYQLERGDMIWFWEHYLGKGRHFTDDPYAAPLRSRSMADLPPACIITAEYDPLRDEGAAYADRLRQAGVPVSHRCCDGMVHGVLGSPIPEGALALQQSIDFLRTCFYPGTQFTTGGNLS